MVKTQHKPNWKNVKVDDLAFKEALTQGLVAIEECSDYNLENFTETQSPKRKLDDHPKKANKKKKIRVQEEIISPSKQGSSVEIENAPTANEPDEFISWTNYNIPDSIIKSLKDQKFSDPTQIQQLTLPAAIMGHRDIIGAAETGSGKTLAFGLPILTGILADKSKNLIKDSADKPLYALILTPTRELAVQIKNHLVEAAKYTDINIAVIVGGMAAVKQERVLNSGPEIVVATPGRLWELIQHGNQHLTKIDNIKYLVIDETDRMLEKGHFEELHDLLERLNQDETKRKSRQTFVFSATLTLVHELPKYLVAKVKRSKLKKMDSSQKLQKIIQVLGITNPKIVDVSGKGTSRTLTESRITCDHTEKDYYVYYFIQKHPGRTLIFCNSVGCVRRLANLLTILGCKVLPLHASKQQKQRLKNLERFRDDPNGILVATDVAARGLDIPKVDHVLHYQTPRTSESYVHRSGRTARATLDGLTVIFIEPSEIQNYLKMCKTLDKSEDLPIFPVQENFLNSVKDRVKLARKLDELTLKIRKGNSEEGWLQKAAEEMDIIVDDFVTKFDKDENVVLKKQADVLRKQLDSLLDKPIFPRGFSGKYPLSSGDFNETFIARNADKAVDIMKDVIEKASKEKKKGIPLYRPKKKFVNNKRNQVVSKKNMSKNRRQKKNK